jgi:hypothetical protein
MQLDAKRYVDQSPAVSPAASARVNDAVFDARLRSHVNGPKRPVSPYFWCRVRRRIGNSEYLHELG